MLLNDGITTSILKGNDIFFFVIVKINQNLKHA